MRMFVTEIDYKAARWVVSELEGEVRTRLGSPEHAALMNDPTAGDFPCFYPTVERRSFEEGYPVGHWAFEIEASERAPF